MTTAHRARRGGHPGTRRARGVRFGGHGRRDHRARGDGDHCRCLRRPRPLRDSWPQVRLRPADSPSRPVACLLVRSRFPSYAITTSWDAIPGAGTWVLAESGFSCARRRSVRPAERRQRPAVSPSGFAGAASPRKTARVTCGSALMCLMSGVRARLERPRAADRRVRGAARVNGLRRFAAVQALFRRGLSPFLACPRALGRGLSWLRCSWRVAAAVVDPPLRPRGTGLRRSLPRAAPS